MAYPSDASLAMIYAIIQPPLPLRFREMPKKELREYFAWFQAILPERLTVLTAAVRETAGFEDWNADFTPESLVKLGNWFATQVEARPRTQQEIQKIESRLSFPMKIPGDELANRTFSLAIDVGMYLSQVFLKTHPLLRWEQPFGGKKSIDYGQPVLASFRTGFFNPVHMLVTLAYGVLSKQRDGKSLRDLYDIWAKMI